MLAVIEAKGNNYPYRVSDSEAENTETSMAKEKENYPVRLGLRSEKDFENFQTLETIMVVKGKDFSNWFARILQSGVTQYQKEICGRKIVNGEYLRGYLSREFGKDISRNDLKILRQEVWTDGDEYFSAPNGKMRVFRYDFEKCLPALESLAERGKEV